MSRKVYLWTLFKFIADNYGQLGLCKHRFWKMVLSIKKVAPIFWRRFVTKFHLQLVIFYLFDWEIINICADHFLYPKCLALSPKKGLGHNRWICLFLKIICEMNMWNEHREDSYTTLSNFLMLCRKAVLDWFQSWI